MRKSYETESVRPSRSAKGEEQQEPTWRNDASLLRPHRDIDDVEPIEGVSFRGVIWRWQIRRRRR